jgi:hypothetical protein
VSKYEGLQLDEDIDQQHKVWVIERVAWVIMAGIIIAGIAGFLGHGPYSSRTETPPDAAYTIEYQRFEHHQSSSEFTIKVMEEGLDGDMVSMRLGNDFLRKAEITGIEPEPDSVVLDADFIQFNFRASAAGGITFHYMPNGFGNIALDISLGERPLQTHPQFILP